MNDAWIGWPRRTAETCRRVQPRTRSAKKGFMDFTVVQSHPELTRYVTDLQAKNSDALGFLPRVAFEQGAEAGRLFLGLLNGQPCGYIFAGSGYRGILRRKQVCIQYGVRRRLYGAMLVAAVEAYGEDLGCHTSVVHCASELEANEFWESVGYRLSGTVPCGLARRYKRHCLNVWVKPLHPTRVVTEWQMGRPRVYASNADRQKAYRDRRRTFVTPPETNPKPLSERWLAD
jgi:GNAT superfamily N-acetyltransferase